VVTLQSDNKIKLDWVDTTPAGGHVAIERAVDGGGFSVLTTVLPTAAGGANTYTDAATSAGHSYKYRIRAIEGPAGGVSAYATGNFAPTTYGTVKQVDYSAGFTGPTAGVTEATPNVVYTGPSMPLNLNGNTNPNQGEGSQKNGVPNVGISNPDQLRLTTRNNSEASTVWTATKVPIDGRWIMSFDVKVDGGTGTDGLADGFAFALQNNSNTFVGDGGGGGGYNGIGANAVGIGFDTWQNHSSTGVFTGNAGPTSNDGTSDPTTQGQQNTGLNMNPGGTGISFPLLHNLRASLAYDGTNLYEQVIDLDDPTRTPFQYNYGAIDLGAILGGPTDPTDPAYHTAWIGFTGATGGVNESVDIKKWVYSRSSVSVGAPAATSNKIDDGSAQRSMLKSLSITFDNPVTTMGTGALKLLKYSPDGSGVVLAGDPGTDISATLNTPTSTDGLTWTWTFKADANTTNGSLNDGVYSYVLDHTKVTGAGGTMAADYLGPTTALNPKGQFHRLFGDVNGNKTVNNADFALFRNTFLLSSGQPGYNSAFDYNNDNTVNNADFAQFRNRFLKSFTYAG